MRYTTKRLQRKTDKRHPNLQDLFSLEDIDIADRVRSTHVTGYSRIALCAADQRYDISSYISKHTASNMWHCMTLKLKYAIDVWSRAVLVSSENPSDTLYYWWLHWAENSTSFKHLEYSKFYRDTTVEEQLTMFWKLLESIANSGEINVTEGIYTYTKENDNDWMQAPTIISEIVLNVGSGREVEKKISDERTKSGNINNYPFDKRPISYKWDDIKDMFIELTLDQLRLVQKEKMHRCTNIDKMLFDACSSLDIEGVQRALDKGANVNALNRSGNCPITAAIEYASDHFRIIDQDYTKEEYRELCRKGTELAKPIVQFLLDHGADIDLFGYDGLQPLAAAYYDMNVEMTEFLLKNGANPNYNSYLNDITSKEEKACVCSTVLHCLYEEIDDYTPEQAAIEDLMYQYGGRLCNWGYDYYGWEDLGKYSVTIEPHKNSGPFHDGNHDSIGDDKFICVEREDGELETIDLTGVDGFKEWLDQYQTNYNDMSYDWDSWRERGLVIAKEIAKLLPNYVTLRYLRDSKVLFKQPHDKSFMYYNHEGDPITIK